MNTLSKGKFTVENGRFLCGGEPLPLPLMESLCKCLNERDQTKAVALAGIGAWKIATQHQLEMLELLRSTSFKGIVETHILYMELTELLVNNLKRTL